MIHLILDTSIYREDPSRRKPSFKSLEWLGTSESVKLHVPYVVGREFQTYQRAECSKHLKQALKSMKGVSNRSLTPKVFSEVKGLHSKLQSLEDVILDDTEKEFDVWAKGIGAQKIELCLDQSKEAMDAYFTGSSPFNEPKIRKDIPDSFVARAVEKLASGVEEVHFVVADANLRKSLEGHDKIKAYKSLTDFISSDLIQDELLSLSVLEDYKALKDSIEAFESTHEVFENTIRIQIGEALVHQEINDSSIPDDNHIATINSYYEADDIELDFEKAIYLGDSKIGLPFEVSIEVNAYFYIFKGDYYAMDEAEMPLSVSDHNDHYFEAEKDFYIRAFGVSTAEIDEETVLATGQLDDALNLDSISIAEILDIELIYEPS